MFTTLGHQKQKDFLRRQIERQSYAQSYLFSGPSGIGKRRLAIEFAQAIITGNAEANAKNTAENSMDLLLADAAEMTISQMRDLQSALALSPFAAAKKVAVIDNFEQASREVSNALLKTLEEPNPTTVIILITNNYKALLPTIVSRTQRLCFSTLTSSELDKLKDELKNLPNLAKLQSFNGRIGKAIRYTLDPEYASRFDFASGELNGIKKIVPAERLLSVKKLAELEDAELSELFDSWLDIEQSRLIEHPENYKNLTLLSRAIRDIRRNINKKLILQKVLLELTI
jgi:DNA polymerase-3 subunit delta'